jgi:ADP-ribosylglycohydrolase
MNALLTDKDYASAYRQFGRKYPHAGYGASFIDWFSQDDAGPYNSWGNGSAMRVSPIGWAFNTREKVLEEARLSAEVTHNHPEGIKGAQATALAIYLARTGGTKDTIKADIEDLFDYDLSSRTVDDIRPTYTFDISCQGSVPQSILCFLEADSARQAIRLAVSLGGDADTQACIAGSIAEAYYGPLGIGLSVQVRKYLPPELLSVVDAFGRKHLSDECA